MATKWITVDQSIGIQHLKDKLKEVEERGGEGIMLRAPNSLYEGKRYMFSNLI
jgi:ATP-dependent DNA ligase